jgi:hypothetical protein
MGEYNKAIISFFFIGRGGPPISLLLHVIIQKGGTRFSAIVTIVVLGHETSDSGDWRVLSKTSDLAITFNSVVLERLHGNGLVATLDLFGLGVDLLFALLTSSTETEDQVKG